jgi:hypothetical protein
MNTVSCTWCNDVVTHELPDEGDLATLLSAHDDACDGHIADGLCGHPGPCYARSSPSV